MRLKQYMNVSAGSSVALMSAHLSAEHHHVSVGCATSAETFIVDVSGVSHVTFCCVLKPLKVRYAPFLPAHNQTKRQLLIQEIVIWKN